MVIMENTNKQQYLYFRESAIQSILSDTYMFGMIFAGFFANALYFDDKWYIYLFFMFMGFSSALARTSKNYHRFTSKKELKDFVDKI